MKLTVDEIAKLLGGKVLGKGSTNITGITNSESPKAGHITFAQDEATARKLQNTEIACLIVSDKVNESDKTLIQVPYPKLAWAKLLEQFYPARTYTPGISKLASIASSARIGEDVTIEPFVFIGENAVIGSHTVIKAHTYIDCHVTVGENTVLHSGVKVYENCEIGSKVIIHAGTVVGADGFGYVSTPQSQEKVPQVGRVIIQDGVELGACVAIDRATIGETIIGEGTKIDNMVQIGHNVKIGKHSVISSQTGISGSSRVGNHVTMGGKVGLGDHVEIGDWTMVGAGSGFPSGKKVPPRQIVFGEPARPYAQARKQIAAQQRSAEMYEQIKVLRKKVTELEEKLQTPTET